MGEHERASDAAAGDGPDPFDLIGVEARFELDAGEVRRRWLAHAARLHPDVAPDPDECGRALARLSRAREILENPELRADTLLVRLGGPTRERCRDLPDGFLIEMMAVREELEESEQDSDAEAVARWGEWAEERRAAMTEEMRERFASLSDPPGAEELRAIRERLNAWRYIERMLEQMG
ncbi:MAG: iron-sulfur cluster co-chaperone HscB C-terminal domain-containing protein [Phycisphaerales bacterium]